jgi:hypothetical protein
LAKHEASTRYLSTVPTSRGEWWVFSIGLAAILAAASLIGATLIGTTTTAVRQSHVRTRPTASQLSPSPTRTRPTASQLSPSPSAPTVKNVASPAPALGRLRLVAFGGRSWVSVRSGSQSGSRLFEGILAQGQAVVFRGARLWVRFGGASNIRATVNGHPFPLPSGTVDLLVTLARSSGH